MNQDQIASYYQQTSVHGANPAGLVVKLYDAILEDFRRALEALSEGNIEGRVAALNHALLVIAELEGVLDHERAATIARQLRGFYSVTRAMVLEANARCSREQIEKIISLYRPLRQAWQQVESDVAAGKIVLSEDLRRPQTQTISWYLTQPPDGGRSNWKG